MNGAKNGAKSAVAVACPETEAVARLPRALQTGQGSAAVAGVGQVGFVPPPPVGTATGSNAALEAEGSNEPAAPSGGAHGAIRAGSQNGAEPTRAEGAF